MNFSYWERQAFLKNIDFLVVGSGIIGLNAAINVKIKAPQSRIVVVEKGPFSDGASTRNAGFACFGSPTELLDDLKKMTEEEVGSLVNKRFRGLEELRELLGDSAIGYRPNGGFELFRRGDEAAFEESLNALNALNALTEHYIGLRPYRLVSDSEHHWPFGGQIGAIANLAEGSIDTGKMMFALLVKAQSMGIEVINGLKVLGFAGNASNVSVEMEGGVIEARHVLICTNGFAKQLIPELEVHPARNQVLITEPLSDLGFDGTFHVDRGYVYFRNVDNRLLLGGFRNLDFQTENTDQHGQTEIVQQALLSFAREFILPNSDFKIAHVWSGILGIGPVKSPIIKSVHPRIHVGVRMGGMGVAIGSLVGKEVAELSLQS